MGLKLNVDLDTTIGPSKEVYVRIENIQLNRTFGKVNVGITYWINKELQGNLEGQIENEVIIYKSKSDVGEEISLPTHFSFDMKRPIQVKIPIYEERTYSEEVPYIGFDENGDEITKWKTEEVTEKKLIGERLDETQIVDLDIESRLLSWCYGQLKAKLGEIIPIENIEDL